MTIEKYIEEIDKDGLENVWDSIIKNGLSEVQNAGELYEIGLAHINKKEKKENGKYFTPFDVADVMSDWFAGLKGENVCDVCCGTGNLILSYLNKIGYTAARDLIAKGHLYLYDKDALALKICVALICKKYGNDLGPQIHSIVCDFLDKSISLPESCKVISNPPYFKISEIDKNWQETEILRKSKEFYAAIMEKILNESKSSVVITPYSFLGSEKFLPLRKKMNLYNGFIVAFDNVPGNIFAGKKHGVFNSNSTNSVRAAITVTENRSNVSGYRCSNLIRFKNEERKKLLKTNILNRFVGTTYQIIDSTHAKYCKCGPIFENIYKKWTKNSIELKTLLSVDGEFNLYVPNTCRYYTVASVKELNRTGKIRLAFSDSDTSKIVYCFLNSSFCYWYWRLFDGGITYTASLLKSLPIIDPALLQPEDKTRLLKITDEMQKSEDKYLVYKKNAGSMQENIKFPDKYRTEINDVFLKAIGVDKNSSIFNEIHANSVFSEQDK